MPYKGLIKNILYTDECELIDEKTRIGPVSSAEQNLSTDDSIHVPMEKAAGHVSQDRACLLVYPGHLFRRPHSLTPGLELGKEARKRQGA